MNEQLRPVWFDWPDARICQHLVAEDGVPVEFVFQLEYNVEATLDGRPPQEWRQVARFDHQLGEHTDVREHGLHMDVYREGHKFRVVEDFPRMELRKAPQFCRDYLEENADELLARFERWHDIRGPYTSTFPTRR